MALARGSCAQGTHVPASTGSCLAGSLGFRVPRVPRIRLLGSPARPSAPALDAHPCLVSWSQHSAGPRAQTPFSCPQGKCQPCCPGNSY